MDQRRKVTIIILIALTLFLGVGSILVTQLIRNNQAPTDSGASGFGAGATKDLYDDVAQTFGDAPCEAFLTLDKITDASELGITEMDTIKYVAEEKLPLKCVYDFGDDKFAILELHSYNTDSFIDNSQQELFDRINSLELLGEPLDEGNTQGVDYFYGVGASGDIQSICRTTYFQVQNDFEYAELTYYGFDDCEALEVSNATISLHISNQISGYIIGVNANFINEAISLSDYRNIRQALQSVSCTYLLTERTDREANAPELLFADGISYFKTRPSEGDQLKNCEYKFSESKTYNLRIRAIDLISNNPQEFKNNVNSLFEGTPSTANANNLEFSYGNSAETDGACRAVMFLPNDEYTFLDIIYTGLSCSDSTEVNGVVTNFTESTRKLIDSIAN